MTLEKTFRAVKRASKQLAQLGDDKRNDLLLKVADAIDSNAASLLEANSHDLARMDRESPLYDRLQLTEARLREISDSMRQVASLPSPLGRVLKESTLPNGMHLRRVAVPFGVIGVVYEARPNVTFDVFALCLKSGNASVLKCGRDAFLSSLAAVELIHRVLRDEGVDPNIVALLPASHEATGEMLRAVGYIDLCIPRGSKRLITFVRDTARIPVIETGAGVVNCYFDDEGDLQIGRDIIFNAKTRRPSVCNTLDTLLICRSRLADLPALCAPLQEKRVVIHADEEALASLSGSYPADLLVPAKGGDEWHTEWMSLNMCLKTVADLDEALAHIDTYGSGHSESIITENAERAVKFQTVVDAACVYVNTPTSFTDGGQFGLGAEIGISTQKLGARGPMGLEEMTTYKWLIDGHGQVRA